MINAIVLAASMLVNVPLVALSADKTTVVTGDTVKATVVYTVPLGNPTRVIGTQLYAIYVSGHWASFTNVSSTSGVDSQGRKTYTFTGTRKFTSPLRIVDVTQ